MFAPKLKEDKHWQKLFEITMATYRVTDIFPRDEILKIQVRGAMNKTFAFYTQKIVDGVPSDDHVHEFIGGINYVRSLLLIARENRFTNEINCVVLDRELQALIESVVADLRLIREAQITQARTKREEKALVSEEGEDAAGSPKEEPRQLMAENQQKPGLNDRQKTILEYLRNNETRRLQLKDIMNNFSGLTDRTIRNDLSDLCQRKHINHNGGYGRSSYYWISE
jgi:hypothetical protein